MIKYEKLWLTMEKKKITKYQLVHKHGFSQSTITRLRENQPVVTTTIDDLCRVLKCNVQNIMEYVPNEPQSLKNKDK